MSLSHVVDCIIRYEAGINSGVIKIIVGSWYLFALVATASYAGEIRSFFINPGVAPPLGYHTLFNTGLQFLISRQPEGGRGLRSSLGVDTVRGGGGEVSGGLHRPRVVSNLEG